MTTVGATDAGARLIPEHEDVMTIGFVTDDDHGHGDLRLSVRAAVVEEATPVLDAGSAAVMQRLLGRRPDDRDITASGG
jgi:hypothetical protein